MWSVLALWHRLYLRPLPHQQGSLALTARRVVDMTRPGYRSPHGVRLRAMMGSTRTVGPGGTDGGRARGRRAAAGPRPAGRAVRDAPGHPPAPGGRDRTGA